MQISAKDPVSMTNLAITGTAFRQQLQKCRVTGGRGQWNIAVPDVRTSSPLYLKTTSHSPNSRRRDKDQEWLGQGVKYGVLSLKTMIARLDRMPEPNPDHGSPARETLAT